MESWWVCSGRTVPPQRPGRGIDDGTGFPSRIRILTRLHSRPDPSRLVLPRMFPAPPEDDHSRGAPFLWPASGARRLEDPDKNCPRRPLVRLRACIWPGLSGGNPSPRVPSWVRGAATAATTAILLTDDCGLVLSPQGGPPLTKANAAKRGRVGTPPERLGNGPEADPSERNYL
jgi:hypothetical protein